MIKLPSDVPNPKNVTWEALDRMRDGSVVVSGTFKCSDMESLTKFTKALENMEIRIFQSTKGSGGSWIFHVYGCDLERNSISFSQAQVPMR